MNFKLTSKYSPTGDQPEAIRQLTDGINRRQSPSAVGRRVRQNFTVANGLQTWKSPLELSHNKTLAAQLYEEMKGSFPDNAVEYYVSHYDYYQPEAYLPTTDTYIEKDLAINDDIDKLRLSAVSAHCQDGKTSSWCRRCRCIYGMAVL